MSSVHQNVLGVVQQKFDPPEIVRSIHFTITRAQDGPYNSHRILALVGKDSSAALFVFHSKSKQPRVFTDLTIESAFPINSNFECDTNPIRNNKEHIIFIASYKKVSISFQIEIGEESANFASEVIRAKELSTTIKLDYGWIDKYVPRDNYLETNIDDEMLNEVQVRVPHASGNLNRESMLKYELSLKQPLYCNDNDFTIFVGTWNVSGRPVPIDLTQFKKWLECFGDEAPDIYAIGFQELDLSKEAFLFNETTRELEWLKAVEHSVHSNEKYRLVAIVRLVGIQLIVLIKNSHFIHIHHVAIDTVGTGILGKMGNKGGVAVSFELHKTSICFVNSHLAAHVEEVERRNSDFNDINNKINFKRHPQAIKDHDQIYWLGDLNYRINELKAKDVKSLIASNNLEQILKKDQLEIEKCGGKILKNYDEGQINFPPTYKYDFETDRYDSSEKQRAPAWTDRIFFKGKGIDLRLYECFMSLRTSDHKPVQALFKSKISVVDIEKYRKIHEDLLKNFDKMENEYLPQVTIDTTEICFDLVKFREPQTKAIIAANTGMVPVDFKFIQKNDEKSYCKDWLRIIPSSARINPGQKCDILLEVTLEQAMIRLDDILILHLEGGKDLFITVSAECQRSCFTMSIATLCRCPMPVLSIPADQLKNAENGQSNVLYSVPRELFLLVDHLNKYGLKTKELFEAPTSHREIIQIRDWLDHGYDCSMPGSIHAVAESLMLFLSFTRDPVVPYHLYKRCMESCENFLLCKEILESFPPTQRNVFLYICMFLQELLKYANDNGLEPHGLAILFSALMRTPERSPHRSMCRKKTRFIEQFLTNDLVPLITTFPK